MRKIPKSQWSLLQDECGELNALAERLAELSDEATDYYDSRSERWQESANGYTYSDWRDAIEEARQSAEIALDQANAITAEPGEQ